MALDKRSWNRTEEEMHSRKIWEIELIALMHKSSEESRRAVSFELEVVVGGAQNRGHRHSLGLDLASISPLLPHLWT